MNNVSFWEKRVSLPDSVQKHALSVKNKHMHTNINTYTSFYTCNSNINIPICKSFLIASVLHIAYINAKCQETTKHTWYKHYVGHWYKISDTHIWLYHHLHVTCGHCTVISYYILLLQQWWYLGPKPKPSLAVIIWV